MFEHACARWCPMLQGYGISKLAFQCKATFSKPEPRRHMSHSDTIRANQSVTITGPALPASKDHIH